MIPSVMDPSLSVLRDQAAHADLFFSLAHILWGMGGALLAGLSISALMAWQDRRRGS